MAAELKLTKLTPVTGTEITVEGTLLIGTTGVPQVLEVKGNLIADKNVTVATDMLVLNTSTGRTQIKGLAASNDVGSGLANTTTLTNVKSDTLSTGVGSIKLTGATARDNTGFIKIYVGTTPVYIPYFSNIS
jgi:hypothetical protein